MKTHQSFLQNLKKFVMRVPPPPSHSKEKVVSGLRVLNVADLVNGNLATLALFKIVWF